MVEEVVKINLEDGKYTVVYDPNTCTLDTLRYGEPWRSHVGDNLIMAMVNRIVAGDKLITEMTRRIVEYQSQTDEDSTQIIVGFDDLDSFKCVVCGETMDWEFDADNPSWYAECCGKDYYATPKTMEVLVTDEEED